MIRQEKVKQLSEDRLDDIFTRKLENDKEEYRDHKSYPTYDVKVAYPNFYILCPVCGERQYMGSYNSVASIPLHCDVCETSWDMEDITFGNIEGKIKIRVTRPILYDTNEELIG